MVKPSGPRRSAPEVELCIPVIDEESTKGRRISMMISEHLLTDAPKPPLGPIGRPGDDLHDVHQAMANNMLGFTRNHWEDGSREGTLTKSRERPIEGRNWVWI